MSEFVRTKFDVLRKTNESALSFENSRTIHEGQRAFRRNKALELGKFEVVESFVVDTGHPDGLELHSVTSTGVVIIANIEKKHIITYLIARPGQIKRYGINSNDLIEKAYEHSKLGLNLI